MMLTAAERQAEYFGELGRCEACGTYVPESELTEVDRVLECPDCFAIDE